MAKNKSDEGASVSPETTAAPSMGFGTPPAAGSTEAAVPPNGIEQGRPYCGKHNVLMRATGGRKPTEDSGGVTYYQCPVKGCAESQKMQRGKIPAEPLTCQQRTCREGAVALEVDARRSSVGQLVMVCPNCACEVQVPRPGFNLRTPAPVIEDWGHR